MKAELGIVVRRAVEEEEAVFMEGDEDAGSEEFGVLGFGDGDGVALELAGDFAEFDGIESFAKLVAESSAFCPEGDDDGFAVVIDEEEVAGAGFELETEEVGGFAKMFW